MMRTRRELKPFWGRALVMDSPVDQEQRDSGLIVLMDETNYDAKRGVVVSIDIVYDDHESGRKLQEMLVPGTVIFYKGGIRLGDMYAVSMQDIIAYYDEGAEGA